MPAFGLTIFTGAFLLFLVQPLIARFILPWFGGGPAVWTTCMLFFQMLLLGGYAYAHCSTRWLQPRRQVVLHLALLAAALLLLPITPGDHWKPLDGASPTLRILVLLAACLGLPYLVLAATSPLLQAWFSLAHPGVSPYRLYALSNVGSLLALISYPFLVEPNLSRRAQATAWSLGLLVFVLLCVWCAAVVWQRTHRPAPATPDAAPAAAPLAEPAEPLLARKVWLWFALPACGVVLLLAVTNRICQDVAVIPFLWVLPLSLYLLSFIISFDSPRWYWRPLWLPLLVAGVGGLIWMHRWAGDLETTEEIAIYVAAMFVCCMVCHGELYRLRPAAQKLTAYYLAIAAGGAAGGLFVALLAPVLFAHYHELQLGFALIGCLLLAVLLIERPKWAFEFQLGFALISCLLPAVLLIKRPKWALPKRLIGWAIILLTTLGAAAAAGLLYRDAKNEVRDVAEIRRNFYGVLKVLESEKDNPEAHKLTLQHGGTTHGMQFVARDKRRLPTTYYVSRSGIGRLMKHFQPAGGRRVGVVGLGTGSLAVWGRAGDYFRFYEINDAVPRLARQRFFYLTDTPARVDIAMGDARLSLEREPSQNFDIIALDAFSSDAVPVHLLTREAFTNYVRHLKTNGVIAVHISNRCLDLQPVVRRVVEHFGFAEAFIKFKETDDLEGYDEQGDETDAEAPGAYSSDWVLLSYNKEFLQRPEIAGAASPLRADSSNVKLWTDDESSLWRILMVETNSLLGRLQRVF